MVFINLVNLSSEYVALKHLGELLLYCLEENIILRVFSKRNLKDRMVKLDNFDKIRQFYDFLSPPFVVCKGM